MRRRALGVAGALLAVALLGGCGSHDGNASSASTPPANGPSAAKLAEMQKLVDGAESLAAEAERNAAFDDSAAPR